MAMAERQARVVWEGTLREGQGQVTAESSQVIVGAPVTWAARTEESGGRTSPEELLAAAHASCFAMALSGALTRRHTPAERLEVSANCSLDRVDGGLKVTSMHLSVRGKVSGIDDAIFNEAAEGAKRDCPISGALAGNVDISLDAELETP